VMQVSKTFDKVAADNKLWKSIFEVLALGLYTKKETVSFKNAAVYINNKRGRMKNIFSRIWALSLPLMRHTFQAGASVDEIKRCESEMGIRLPTYIREYFLITNGEYQVPPGMGFIHGSRLLPINEMCDSFKAMRDSGGCLETTADGKKVIGLPLTSMDGYQQLLVHEVNGKVYLESGWNVFVKADNWHEYLFHYVANAVNDLSVMLM